MRGQVGVGHPHPGLLLLLLRHARMDLLLLLLRHARMDLLLLLDHGWPTRPELRLVERLRGWGTKRRPATGDAP